MGLLRVSLFFVVSIVGGCSGVVAGWLGVKWGDDASAAATRLGMKCDRWDVWESGFPFEACYDFDRSVTALGAPGRPRLIRGGSRLEGVQLIYGHCSGDGATALREKVVKEFKLETSGGTTPYQIFRDGSLVHFDADPRSSTCSLTLASPAFGKAFEASQLKAGLGGLVGTIPPR